MANLVINCPHCLTKDVFAPFQEQYKHPTKSSYATFFTCNNCHQGIVVQITSTKSPSSCPGNLRTASGYDIGEIMPTYKQDIPEYLPSNIERLFQEAVDNYADGRKASAGMMCRKVIDVSTKSICPPASKQKKLVHRIDDLEAERIITPALKEWAHAVRFIGNDAAHEEEDISDEDADDIFSFTELFLRYIFTLPKMLELRRPTPAETPPAETPPAKIPPFV